MINDIVIFIELLKKYIVKIGGVGFGVGVGFRVD